jgi:hypothetical protein
MNQIDKLKLKLNYNYIYLSIVLGLSIALLWCFTLRTERSLFVYLGPEIGYILVITTAIGFELILWLVTFLVKTFKKP